MLTSNLFLLFNLNSNCGESIDPNYRAKVGLSVINSIVWFEGVGKYNHPEDPKVKPYLPSIINGG
jgi:hypothetical protein